MRGRKKTTEKEEQILRAAAVVFAARDFHEVLMEDVAAEAGVGKGTLYRYFPTKDDLFFSTILSGLEELRGEIARLAARGGDLAEVLEAIAVGVLCSFWPRRPLLSLMHRYEAGLHKRQGTDWLERRSAIAELVAGVFARAVERGEVRAMKPRLAAELYLGMVRSALVYRGEGDTPEALGRELVSILLGGLSHETKKPPTLKIAR